MTLFLLHFIRLFLHSHDNGTGTRRSKKYRTTERKIFNLFCVCFVGLFLVKMFPLSCFYINSKETRSGSTRIKQTTTKYRPENTQTNINEAKHLKHSIALTERRGYQEDACCRRCMGRASVNLFYF